MRLLSLLSFAALAGGLAACGEVKPIIADAPEAVDGGDAPVDAVDAPDPIDAPDAPPGDVTLTVTRTGNGTITSGPTGIACGSDCSEAFAPGTVVTLTAAVDPGNTFMAWGGACSGALATCTLTLTADTAVTATFAVATHTINAVIAGNGTGRVTIAPAALGLDCPGDCTATATAGAQVTLTAAATGGSLFVGWSGGPCSGTAPCTFTVGADVTVNAAFALQNTLIVTRTGNGSGSVSSSPAGITCGSDCTETYAPATVVTLTPTADASSTFTGWSGACSGTGACTVTMDAARTVAAAFTLRRYPLTVSKTGSGSMFGTVTSSPAGIACGADCTEDVDHGAMVTLTATGSAGATFDGWPAASGCSGTGPCTVTVTAATTISAPFTLAQYTVTIVLAGGGTGTVTSSPAGINCPGTCTRSLAYGTAITLTAAPSANHRFGGWSGACTGTGTCALTITGNVSATATFIPPPNVMFVTSSQHTGSLGGLAGADALCQARAQGVNLPGTYRAWLSTSTVNAIDRLGTASGWVRPDGLPFANSRADLAAGRILYPPVINERGSPTIGTVWTATTSTGTLSGTNHCTNWTNGNDTAGTQTYGSNEYGTFGWTSNGGANCTSQQHLYCFGVDRVSAVDPTPPATFRRAFVTIGSWLPNAGLAAADTLCNTEASANALPGSYRALLASNTASAASRFSTSGAPWIRTDDVVLATTAAAFLASTGTHWQAPLNVTAAGAYVTSRTWAGAPNLSSPGMSPAGANSNCLNWSSAAATNYGAVGLCASSRILTAFANYTTQGGITSCDNTQHKLMCLQQ